MTENTSSQSYADTSSFAALFDKPTRVKILDVFLGKHHKSLSQQAIADLAGINQSSVSRNMTMALDIGLVEEAGTEGNKQLYTLNTDHPAAGPLRKARHELTKYSRHIHGYDTRDLPLNPDEVDPNETEQSDTELRESVDSPLSQTDA